RRAHVQRPGLPQEPDSCVVSEHGSRQGADCPVRAAHCGGEHGRRRSPQYHIRRLERRCVGEAPPGIHAGSVRSLRYEATMRTKISVLIVDDSAVVRQVLTAVLQKDAGIEVMGAVADPIFAMQRMNKSWPDVIVLDVEMPRMDGI